MNEKLNRYHLIAAGNYVILRDNIGLILLSALLSPSEPAAMSPLFLALGSLLASAASAQQQLGLDIFYESLCPDSTR